MTEQPNFAEPSSYAAAYAELEEILERLNADEVDVDVLAREVERGALLISWCRTRITHAQAAIEKTVASLEADAGRPTRNDKAQQGELLEEDIDPALFDEEPF